MSLKVNVYNQAAEIVKDLELSESIFALKPNEELLHQAIVAQQANSRQILAHTKDRSEVAGSGKKPWKQKGTGRARVGSVRSPIWIGGGVVFGPRNTRNFKKKINQKMKQKALFMALSDKVSNNTFVVLDNLDMTEYKTKKFNDVLSVLEKKILKNERRNILILSDVKNEKLQFSVRNLTGVKIINLENINLLDVLNYKNLLLTEEAVKKIIALYVKADK
ncbi:50S ribosomal protein L4 [Candidatus Falkowbacteria bacterium]|uniref:Large ribosomal subunit protein uL4 n=1 Tax=Candidatus Falkowbacteria bacterium CG10_big_fil_rev_8_21_14_0_10_37_18 TaxID=1974562 RepID=A0A2H0V8Z3_9BACT|nr:50S ribosomal protein L4 [Candidatus Falkowbacteria bacterium]NCQ12545.1 50S ribosomal protein L4 [Candidatus Falkowbacteria bacterium]OIO06008.1 MAG: 50S ribosomal protein L4 [Candidatus Falkowbacteria bacterium CG1_02_37_21]PIR95531.1 MAG: 50S ribosomal protein L4 [Candidatus Falkowbacteria bacterium CG10_big_fil_rev_8_21_14_0_10_37_18]